MIWTRHRQEPEQTRSIRRWFAESGFQELSFDGLENESTSGIGVVRLIGKPVPFRHGLKFFRFLR